MTIETMPEDLPETECANWGADDGCQGPVQYGPQSASGAHYARCARHWSQWWDRENELRERYPILPPSDWHLDHPDEPWGSDDY